MFSSGFGEQSVLRYLMTVYLLYIKKQIPLFPLTLSVFHFLLFLLMTLCLVFLIYLNTSLKYISLHSQKMHLLDLIQGAIPWPVLPCPNLLPAPIVGMVRDNYDLCN